MGSLVRAHSKRLGRIFTKAELSWANRIQGASRRLACLFAAKEAIFKSLGLSPAMFFQWSSIEIKPGEGAHTVSFHGNLKKKFQRKGETLQVVWQIQKRYAVAIATRRKICVGS